MISDANNKGLKIVPIQYQLNRSNKLKPEISSWKHCVQ